MATQAEPMYRTLSPPGGRLMRWVPLLAVAGALVIALAAVAGVYNSLVKLDQNVQSQWAQVENAYQRRSDLIPNLVQTVKGAAAFEQGTLEAVVDARSRVGQISPEAMRDITSNPEAFERFQQAQGELSAALSRLLVVSEQYPELKATQNFRDLQAQLEGTENRIAVERMRFNEAAQAFNTRRQSFPSNLIANFFGSQFSPKAYFHAVGGAEHPPEVHF